MSSSVTRGPTGTLAEEDYLLRNRDAEETKRSDAPFRASQTPTQRADNASRQVDNATQKRTRNL